MKGMGGPVWMEGMGGMEAQAGTDFSHIAETRDPAPGLHPDRLSLCRSIAKWKNAYAAHSKIR